MYIIIANIAELILVSFCHLKLRFACLIYVQIRKGNVDHFSGGQMIPKCELLLQWPHTDKPYVCLLHGIDLIGAKGCTFFTLYIPPASE